MKSIFFCRLAGLTDPEILRKEMIAQLCMGDKTHSQLVDLISFLRNALQDELEENFFTAYYCPTEQPIITLHMHIVLYSYLFIFT